MDIIELVNVSKSFNGVMLFKEVNAIFQEGKIYGLIGPNGAGKSVLFKLICHFVTPDKGGVKIHHSFMKKGNDFPESFGILIDRPGYVAGITGFENLKRWANIRNQIGDNEIRKAMVQVGLDPNTPQKLKDYSLGMKQKLALAQAIMEDQQVLILDEPFNALDSESVYNIRELLKTFRSEGKTILLTSHNQEDIDLLCDEVYKINEQTLYLVNSK